LTVVPFQTENCPPLLYYKLNSAVCCYANIKTPVKSLPISRNDMRQCEHNFLSFSSLDGFSLWKHRNLFFHRKRDSVKVDYYVLQCDGTFQERTKKNSSANCKSCNSIAPRHGSISMRALFMIFQFV
jgi:hypothetical protein